MTERTFPSSAVDLSAYARKDTAQTFTEDQTIEEGNVLAYGTSGVDMGRPTGLGLPGSQNGLTRAKNAKWDGVNWVRIIADNDASLLDMDSLSNLVYYTPSDAGNTVGSTITWAEKFRITKAGVVSGSVASTNNFRWGTGTPEGAVSASVGSVFFRTDGASGTTLYVKESGTGNTGWRAMPGAVVTTRTVATKAAAYTTTASDDILLCSGTWTLTLVTAVGNTGKVFDIKNTGTGIITIDANGTQTIDGSLTHDISAQYDSRTLVSDGANWHII